MKELYRVVQPANDDILIETDNLHNNSFFKDAVVDAIDYRYPGIDTELLRTMADYYIKHDLCEILLDMTIEKMEVKREERKEVTAESEMTPAVIKKALIELWEICGNQDCTCKNCPCKSFCPYWCDDDEEEKPKSWYLY